MNNNKLIIAAAGSGKTTYLVKEALKINSDSILITTYTEANEKEIRKKIISIKGCIPANFTILTWFKFLLQHGVRPYQSILDPNIHNKNIGFFLTNKKSGEKFDRYGQPIIYKGKPIYWGEKKDFQKFYFTKNMKIYSDKISKFVFKCNKRSEGLVFSRITRIFNHFFVDEVQDLTGFDLELIKLLFKSSNPVLLVGDPRQVTYLTHPTTKYKKYSEGKIKEFIINELGKKIKCEIDEDTLNISHRNNEVICTYSSKLYPDLPVSKACKCHECKNYTTYHNGVFLIKKSEVKDYLKKYKPIQLRWSNRKKCNNNHPVFNFGESKGLTFDRVLIYPTNDILNWIKNNNYKLKHETRAKFYVGITRAKYSVAIIMDFQNKDSFPDVKKYNMKKV